MIQTIAGVFDAQVKNKYSLRLTSSKIRIEKLKKLKSAIQEFEEEIYTALDADLRKSRFEAGITELFSIYSEIDFAIKNLNRWMRPHSAGRSILYPFAKNKIYYEPKGACLIISPWNYPFQLTMSPLVSAIAAGNCVILKPSEFSAATSRVMAKIVEKAFDSNEIACFEGDESVAKALLSFPFEHIFFTGSTAVGKVVMEAAARSLASVTLELGGKSPVVIDETADIKKAAGKIAWGKLINAGQTCIAPDYVLVHQSKLEEFITYYKSAATDMFFDEKNKKIDHSSYVKIINQKHFDRLKGLIVDAILKGARLVWGGEDVLSDQTIHPVVLTGLTNDCKVMQEEIFGPILPVIAYSDLESAIGIINRKSKPLAMYIFSESRSNIKHLLKSTSSGGVCVNDVLIHFSNAKLPFGGVNESGIGSCHGFFGFKGFSHERAVMFQSIINMSGIVYPPYDSKSWVLKMLRKLM
jgi:aldehyde dehydrogenase (NAD+)